MARGAYIKSPYAPEDFVVVVIVIAPSAPAEPQRVQLPDGTLALSFHPGVPTSTMLRVLADALSEVDRAAS